MLLRRITATVVLLAFSSSTFTWAAPPELQGKLSRGPGGEFTLEKVGTSLELPWFDLATKKPDGYSKPTFDCVSTLWSFWDYETACKRHKGDFNSFSTNWGLTLSVNTAMQFFALAPLVFTGVSVYKRGYFDHDMFAESANIAASKANADALLAKYSDVTGYIDSTTASHNSSAQQKFSAIYNKYDSLQKNHLNRIVIKPTIIDNTGFWKSSSSLPVLALEKRKLPIGYPQFNYNVGRIAASPSDFISEMDRIKSDFNKALDDAKDNLVLQEVEYDLKLSKLVSAFDLPHLNRYAIDDFTVELNAPDQVEAVRTDTVNVTYTIKDKTWRGVLPKYTNSDENIEITLKDGNVRVSNKTDKFLTLSSISVYYNSEVSNYTPESGIELPPETYRSISTSNLIGSKIIEEATYRNIDKAKANSTNFTFGVAVKYKLVDRNLERSLYKTKPYNLLKVLQDAV